VRLDRIGEEFEVEALAGDPTASRPLRFRFLDGFEFDARLSAQGAHQQDNAVLAVALVRALGVHEDHHIADAARSAFAKILLPGRIEVVERDPWVIVDGAHTRESVRGLTAWLAEIPASKRRFVLSLSLDKAVDSILDLILPLADEVVLTRADPIRAVDPEDIARGIAARDAGVRVQIVDDPETAVASARASLESDVLLCVVGSVYLAGVARRVLVQR
jgi:dihydrofolate synthase/folylpolyglutamate synthase